MAGARCGSHDGRRHRAVGCAQSARRSSVQAGSRPRVRTAPTCRPWRTRTTPAGSGAARAILFGVAGPNVRGGDITQYFFEWGKTEAYGNQTPPGTIGSCPAGIMPPSPYCNVPKTQKVSAEIKNLAICTTYHFQLVASNPDGIAMGGDRTFFSATFAHPLKRVTAPHKVKAGARFRRALHPPRRRHREDRHPQQARPGVVVTRNLGTLGRRQVHARRSPRPARRGGTSLAGGRHPELRLSRPLLEPAEGQVGRGPRRRGVANRAPPSALCPLLRIEERWSP